MLHPVNLPLCEAQMLELVKFQSNVLKVACDVNPKLLIKNRVQLVTIFGSAAIVDWFLDRIASIKPFREKFNALVAYLQNHGAERKQILDAFTTDSVFQTQLNSTTFKFQFPHLSVNAKLHVKNLMVVFYDDLLQAGFPVEIHNGKNKITKRSYRDDFWDVNKSIKLCPACDGKRPDMNDGSLMSQNDHVLPKADYPYLSLNPHNLLPICSDCNKIKLAKDLIDNNAVSPIIDFFHPYTRPASQFIRVKVFFKRDNSLAIRITENTGLVSERVKKLIYVLNLEERWTHRVRDEEQRILEVLKSKLRKQNKKNVSTEEFKQKIEEVYDGIEGLTGKFDSYYLNSNYLSYLMENDTAITSLQQQVEQNL